MTREKAWIRRAALLGVFAAVTTIAVAETPSNEVTKFQIEPDGSRVHVANADDNIVVTIDMKTFQEVDRFTTGIDPDGMAWTRLQ